MFNKFLHSIIIICVMLSQPCYGWASEPADLQSQVGPGIVNQSAPQTSSYESDTDEWIVKFKENASDSAQQKSLSKHKDNRTLNKKHKLYVVKGTKEAQALKNDPDVLYVEKVKVARSFIAPNDYYYTHSYDYQWSLKTVNAPTAWDITTGSSNISVAIIDSGMDYDHEDAPAHVTQGWNYLTNSLDTLPSNPHGTSVAGIIGAKTNNSIGMAGINWNVTIVPLHCMNEQGAGSTDDIITAIYDAVDDYHVKVINMSFGYQDDPQDPNDGNIMTAAINYAYENGVIVVASAGNSGNNSVFYPAACPNVISVASVDKNKNRSNFSTYNSYVDITAPGTSVLSIYDPDYTAKPSPTSTPHPSWTYAWVNGTSFSAPYISGLAALAASINPNITPAKFEELLKNNATDLGTAGRDDYFGYGLVDFQKVLSNVQTPTPPATPTPTPTPTPVPMPIIPLGNIVINNSGAIVDPYGKIGASIARINVTGIINPMVDNYVVMVKGVEANYTYYNGVYEFVALVNDSVVAENITVLEGTPTRLIYADIDLNGTTESTDVNLLKGAVAGNRVAIEFPEFIASDVNGEGVVNSSDYNFVKGFIAGNISTLPVYNK